MQSFDQSLMMLLRRGLITEREALRRCSNPNDFKLKLQGIEMSGDAARADMASVMERPEFLEDARTMAKEGQQRQAQTTQTPDFDTDDFKFNLDLT